MFRIEKMGGFFKKNTPENTSETNRSDEKEKWLKMLSESFDSMIESEPELSGKIEILQDEIYRLEEEKGRYDKDFKEEVKNILLSARLNAVALLSGIGLEEFSRSLLDHTGSAMNTLIDFLILEDGFDTLTSMGAVAGIFAITMSSLELKKLWQEYKNSKSDQENIQANLQEIRWVANDKISKLVKNNNNEDYE